MSRTSEMEAKLRKGPAMLGQAKFRERLKKHVVDLAAEVDDLRAQLAACAAGPWRTDVENAPRDGSEVWASWYKPSNPEAVFVTSLYWWEDYGTWRGHGFNVREEWVIAFAVPNPPQVTT